MVPSAVVPSDAVLVGVVLSDVVPLDGIASEVVTS